MPLVGPPLKAPADLPDILKRGLEAGADTVALVSAETRWTWRELEEISDRLARNLLGLGLSPGDRVASLMPNRAALIIYYLACFRAGLVATPLNYRYMPPEIDHALGVSGASCLFAHAERAQDIAASALAGKLPLGLISYDGSLGDCARFEALIEEVTPVDLPAPDRGAPALIFFTSGSTGKPKGVTHSLDSFGSVAGGFAQAMALTGDDVVLPGGSMSHVGALCTALAGLSAGARLVVRHNLDGDELLPLLRDTRPSVLVMLPAALIALLHDHGATRDDFGSLRLCITGGDKFPANLEREFTDLTGLSINETYGMTEIPGCTLSPPMGTVKPGSAGVVCPGYAASLRDDEGKEVAVGSDGRLWVAGAPLMLGYWGNPAATDDAIRDGWLDTGDVMRVDADGYFWFRGRSKQIIVHDGSNICPQEVEEAVMAHPAVASAGVVGVRDAVHGENVWAYVTLKAGASAPTSQDIIRCARQRVGYKAPEAVEFLDTMPLNATGKVDRVALKRMAAERVNAEHPD